MKKTVLKFGLVAAALLAFAACGSAGREWDTTHANEVQRGVHTQADIRTWFGEPFQVQPIADSPMGCTQRWTYVYSHSVYGGATVTDTLVVDFDAAGTVCDNAYVHQEN